MMNYQLISDACDLAKHCSQYVIPEKDITNMKDADSGNGNVFVISRAEFRGEAIVLKRWHGAVVQEKFRILFTERLIRDLDRWRTLTPHKHIAPILGVALHISNLPALVVPAFRTVAQVLKQDPQKDVLSLMNGVAAGLGHLHAQTPPIAHGDLKGSTIFVSPTGTAILSDIGIASIPQPPEWDFKTGDDARWLAPEVLYPSLRPEVEDGEGFQASKAVTCESDVYAFAMASYEMCTRDLPFAPTPPRSVMMAVIQGARPLRPSTEQSPQLTDRLWALIQECWAQKYQDRPKIGVILGSL
ncbi:kinase-like domain-containing protein [Mycena olivaceomarginata]|nr:kinase-like domain-containing protein [Mycena olivaceomarginata]KAJ7893917.1 kinase-like domain-containing protein [Mycena olivaceomarginata]